MSDVAVKVHELSKCYDKGDNAYTTLRDRLAGLVRLHPKSFKDKMTTGQFWALKEASFEIKRGDVVGIVGRNGAGSSASD